ncbi:conserved protein of unknown function [Rhodovastum atsumiense]|uniref:DUF2937 family protein n=1 Tax=Rhodovastum atsumiense TaxID=504468 RepID=A0A5M6J406_9PROT|nr:hypothetical protein [Rhodovastum atsumiense]KAA5614348.1 hypothetical protein F1189_01795 [Rhodovastum atsumiense]CAH2604816.1 conserved protein of unknown function [Rhodovastum atsumiense]
MARPAATLSAFLVMAFLIVGLTGVFATFAAPLPLQRAISREAALDDALAEAGGADYAATLERLRPHLADSAAAIAPGPDLDRRIRAERDAARARFAAEAEATATRLRWLIGVITVTAALFGIVITNVGRGGR